MTVNEFGVKITNLTLGPPHPPPSLRMWCHPCETSWLARLASHGPDEVYCFACGNVGDNVSTQRPRPRVNLSDDLTALA